MTSVRRALSFSIAERYILVLVSLLGNVLIARILSPEEIGLYSVTLAAIGVAQVLRDFGVSSFLIQEKDLSNDHIRTAFGVSLLLGFAIFLALIALAPAVGRFYADERVADLARLSAINFLIIPFCSISIALLRRSMEFKKLAAIGIFGGVLGMAITLSLAWNGFGPTSMVISSLVANCATGVAAWCLRPGHKLIIPSLCEWRRILSFGGRLSLASVITSISMDINDLAVGKILGFSSVAMISRAQGLMFLFHRDLMGAIRNVAYPAFAKLHRDGEDLEKNYVFSLSVITVLAWPFYLFVALNAKAILRLLYGPQWDAAGPLVPWFCLAGAAAATYSLVLPLLTACGRVDLATTVDLVTQPLRALVLVVGVILYESIEIFSIIYAAASVLSIPYVYFMKSKFQATNFSLAAPVLCKSIFVTLFSMTGPFVLMIIYGRVLGPGMLLIASLVCALLWLVGVFVFRHPLSKDVVFIGIVNRIIVGLKR